MSLGRPSTLAFFASLVIPTAVIAANPTVSDSYCKDLIFRTAATTVFSVDASTANVLNERFFAGDPVLTSSDVEFMVDQNLQNLARGSRARVRARVAWGTLPSCASSDFDSTSCIYAEHDSANGVCNSNKDASAVTTCGFPSGDCDIALCIDRILINDFRSGRFDHIIAHELGHAFGLDHVDPATDLGCTGTTTCSGDNDGCDGELMCSNSICQGSSFVTQGDSFGLRDQYNSNTGNTQRYFERKTFQGSATASSLTPTIRSWTGIKQAAYAPRIDCSDGTNPTVPCAAIQTDLAASGATRELRVIRLSNWSATSGWQSHGSIAATTAAFAGSPDIAVTPNGAIAYVAYWSAGSNLRVFLYKYDLSTGALTSYDTGLQSVLPPRVAYYSDILGPVIIGAEPFAGNESTPRWWMQYLPLNGSSLIPVDFGDLDDDGEFDVRYTATDFDFDCDIRSGADKCIIVALHRDRTAMSQDLKKTSFASSRSFSISGVFPERAIFDQSSWEFGAFDSNSVAGVALTASHLIVSFGRSVQSGTSSINTRVVDYGPALSIDNVAAATVLVKSDAESCSTGTHFGRTVPAISMAGGYSIGFCASCTAGEVQSVHQGNNINGDTFCY